VKGEARGLVANRGAITISIMLAPIMQGVDTTIANVALPHMQGSLSVAQDQIAWVLTSYIVAAAIMTPLTGWLAGRFGIKYVFLSSVAGFTLASALCGSATSLAQLVIYRVLQGVCGAALVPLSQSVLLQINPPERHARAMAVWGTGTILGPVIGPALGGWLTDDYNWRWVFYINLPVGALATLGILIFIRETRHAHREPFDFFGFATLSLAIGALQLMLDRGELKDWFSSTEIWISATIAGLCFYLFVVHTVTATDRSFLNRDLLKDSYVDAVSVDIVLFDDYVAEIDADPELDPPVLGHFGFAVDHCALDLGGTAHGIHRARKFHQQAVAGVLNDAAAVLLDLRINQLAQMCFEAFVRPLLVDSHQPRVARNIGGEDRGQPAFDASRGQSGAP
jgi:hypothetical protein